MNRMYKNTAAVLVLTLFTGLAVFSAVQLGGRLFATGAASAQTVTAQSSAQQSSAGSAYGDSSSESYDDDGSGYGRQQTDPYGYGQSSGSDAGSSSAQTYTCPATGCSASTCHATQ